MPEPQTARQVPIDGVGCVVAVVSGKGGGYVVLRR